MFGKIGEGYVPPEINADGVDMAAGKGSHNSMPSSHAANWFAATMTLFLFYRRSLWFMLPLALGVSFSRIYNGVHYPSDVLAGAIIGAGYAAAAAIALESAWQFFGKKYFPRWHEKLPSLVPNLNFGNSKRPLTMAATKIIFRVRDYDLAATLDSGQVFRWQKQNDSWVGVVGKNFARLTQTDGGILRRNLHGN